MSADKKSSLQPKEQTNHQKNTKIELLKKAQKEFEKATSNKRSSNKNTVNRKAKGGSVCARPTGRGKGAARSV